MFNPFTYIRQHWPTVRVLVRHIEGDECGITEWDRQGNATVTLSAWLDAVEIRCVLTHEIQHLRHGPDHARHCQQDETVVRAETARWLLPDIDELAATLADYDIAAAARRLQVLEHIIYDRLGNLSDAERGILDDKLPRVRYAAA